MTVHKFAPSRLPRETIKCLTKMLERAQLQKLTGIAFVAYIDEGRFIADICGEAANDPDKTIEMLRYLEARLRGKRLR